MTGEIQILLVVLVAVGIAVFIFLRRRRRTGAGNQTSLSVLGPNSEDTAPHVVTVRMDGQEEVRRPAEVAAEGQVGESPKDSSHVEAEGGGEETLTEQREASQAAGEQEPLAEETSPPRTAGDVAEFEPGQTEPHAEGGEPTPEGAHEVTELGIEPHAEIAEEAPRSQDSAGMSPEDAAPAVTEGPATEPADEPWEDTSEEATADTLQQPGGPQHEEPASDDQLPRQRGKRSRKKPRKYGGLVRRPPQPQGSDLQGRSGDRAEPPRGDRSLPIEVRLRFERGDSCSVSLLPRRSEGLPEDLTVATPSGELDLRAMQDEWYQDVALEDIARVLRQGTVWSDEGHNGQCSWSLSGRDVYVLAERTDISGWVSQPCLQLGRRHAVLCTERMRSTVEEALRAAGVEPTAVLDSSVGAPPGWVVFRGIVPTTPVPPVGEADILNALRPILKIDISLEGGIRLQYTTWLEGYPPSIRVYGDPDHTTEVLIDSRVASCGADGAYRVSGWDAAGSHTVWCGGTTKSYSIVSFAGSWEAWDAYMFPVALRSKRRLSVCGPLVRTISEEVQSWAASIQVPNTHLIVLGSAPGQYVVATRTSEISGAPCVASPYFRPVWALPRDPLHCSKETTRILLVGEATEPTTPGSNSEAKGRGADGVGTWCRAILDASRKGLSTEPDNDGVRKLWLSYKRLARQIRRARK